MNSFRLFNIIPRKWLLFPSYFSFLLVSRFSATLFAVFFVAESWISSSTNLSSIKESSFLPAFDIVFCPALVARTGDQQCPSTTIMCHIAEYLDGFCWVWLLQEDGVQAVCFAVAAFCKLTTWANWNYKEKEKGKERAYFTMFWKYHYGIN